MSLIIEVKVNHQVVGVVVATRVTNIDVERPDPDQVSRYRVTRMGYRTTEYGHVDHTYGDGAMVLARKALEAAEQPAQLP